MVPLWGTKHDNGYWTDVGPVLTGFILATSNFTVAFDTLAILLLLFAFLLYFTTLS